MKETETGVPAGEGRGDGRGEGSFRIDCTRERECAFMSFFFSFISSTLSLRRRRRRGVNSAYFHDPAMWSQLRNPRYSQQKKHAFTFIVHHQRSAPDCITPMRSMTHHHRAA